MRKWILMYKRKDRQGDPTFWEVTYLIRYNKKDCILNTYRFRKGVIKSGNYRNCKISTQRCTWDGDPIGEPTWIDRTIRKPKKIIKTVAKPKRYF